MGWQKCSGIRRSYLGIWAQDEAEASLPRTCVGSEDSPVVPESLCGPRIIATEPLTRSALGQWAQDDAKFLG